MLQNMNLKTLLLTTAMFLLVNTISVYALNYTSNSTSSILAGTSITHSLYWQDDMGLSGYIFSFDNCTTSLANDSWNDMTGNGNWSNVTKIINSTIGCNVKWCIYANDSSNNWNGTSCQDPFSYITTNQPPNIYFIESIPNQDPIGGSTTTVIFIVSVSDINGYSDISSVSAEFNKTGEETKFGDCNENNVINSTARNYSCLVDMEYYDANGNWSVMVTAEDTSSEIDTEWSSFTYNLLTSWVMDGNSLNFGNIYHGENYIGATENPMILENIGNDDLSGEIKVTALDLTGVTNSSEYIPAGNFSVNVNNAQGGDVLANNTAVIATGTSLNRGESSKEELYFYILDVPLDLSFQVYNTTGLGQWTIST
jgi:hypothetical protein